METLFSTEYLYSSDSVICACSGVIVGVLFWQFLRGWSLGLVVNLVLGAVGGLISGALFNQLDLIDVSDFADPMIAGVVGGLLVVGIAGLVRRP